MTTLNKWEQTEQTNDKRMKEQNLRNGEKDSSRRVTYSIKIVVNDLANL